VGLPFGFAQDKKAHAFTGTAKPECVAPTALGIRRPCFPALPGGATFFRACGAPTDEPRFSCGRLPSTLSSECAERERAGSGVSRSGRAWLRRERLPVLACTGTFGHAAGVSSVRARVPVPQNLAYSVFREHAALVERAGTHRASDRSPRLARQDDRRTTLGALSSGPKTAPTDANVFWDRCLLWKLRMPVGNRKGESYSGAVGIRGILLRACEARFEIKTLREKAWMKNPFTPEIMRRSS
jgi:hypothetical protein